MVEYTTIAEWTAYANIYGYSVPATATDELGTQALARATLHIRTRWFLSFAPEYQVIPLLPNVADALKEATNLAASHELDTPNIYSHIATPAGQRILKKFGSAEWETPKSVSSENNARASQAVDATILALMTPFLPVEVIDSGGTTIGLGFTAVGLK